MLAVVALATACEGPMGPQGPRGADGRVNKTSVPITILGEHWIREPATGPFRYFYYRMEMPELTEYVINEGFFYTYFCWNDGLILVQEGTGYTSFHETTDGELYTQTIACDYNVGEMTFYVRSSNFNDIRPGDMQFRFVAFW